jgi:hypothetical protein
VLLIPATFTVPNDVCETGSVVAVAVVGIFVGVAVKVGIGVEKVVGENVSVGVGVKIDTMSGVVANVQEVNPITKTTKSN